MARVGRLMPKRAAVESMLARMIDNPSWMTVR